AAGVLSLSFVTVGAIPFAAGESFRVIPFLVVGSAVAGGIAMGLGSAFRAPHGGLFVLSTPHAVGNIGAFLLAIAVGMVVTAVLVSLLKKNIPAQEAEQT